MPALRDIGSDTRTLPIAAANCADDLSGGNRHFEVIIDGERTSGIGRARRSFAHNFRPTSLQQADRE
jgi:hypothetical protein